MDGRWGNGDLLELLLLTSSPLPALATNAIILCSFLSAHGAIAKFLIPTTLSRQMHSIYEDADSMVIIVTIGEVDTYQSGTRPHKYIHITLKLHIQLCTNRRVSLR